MKLNNQSQPFTQNLKPKPKRLMTFVAVLGRGGSSPGAGREAGWHPPFPKLNEATWNHRIAPGRGRRIGPPTPASHSPPLTPVSSLERPRPSRLRHPRRVQFSPYSNARFHNNLAITAQPSRSHLEPASPELSPSPRGAPKSEHTKV